MPSLLFAKLRLELEKKEKEGKRGLVSSAVVFDSLSLCRKKMTTRQKRKRKGGGAASSADSGSKGGKLFYLRLACRRCTLFSLKNALSRRWRKRLGCSFRALVFNFSLSLSLSRLIPSFFISSLARFSSSMASRRAHAPLSVETEVASGFFTARDRCASRSFPHDYATRRAFVLAWM